MNNPKPTSKRNSLTAFRKPEPILPTSAPEPAAKPAAKANEPKSKRGPQAKAASEKRSEKVLLSLTPAEREKSLKRAGRVPEATVIRDFLYEHGYFK